MSDFIDRVALLKQLRKSREEYFQEHFSYDPSTGASESSAAKEEYLSYLDDNIALIQNFAALSLACPPKGEEEIADAILKVTCPSLLKGDWLASFRAPDGRKQLGAIRWNEIENAFDIARAILPRLRLPIRAPRSCHQLEYNTAADPKGLILYFASEEEAVTYAKWLATLPASPSPSKAEE